MEHATEGPSLVLPERGDIIKILRTSPDFLRLWLAQMISMGGDWFTTVPVMAMAYQLTNSPFATSLVLLCNTLPTFLVTPFSGVVADRFNRKQIIIICNLISAVTVLGFLFVDRHPERVWLCYACTAILVVMGACILPAATAGIPSFVGVENLSAANALFGTTWGITVAVGSALGGYVASAWGRPVAFELDAAGLLVSAFLVMSIRRKDFRGDSGPPIIDEDSPPVHHTVDDVSFWAALTHLRANPHLVLVVLAKAFWGVGGGLILLLSVFPIKVFAAADPDRGVGLMYSMRGVGTLLGPLLALAMVRNQTKSMGKAIGISLVLCGVLYVLFSKSPTLELAAFCVLVANLGTGAVWVVSTTMMQLSVPDSMMGRLSAIDLGGVTLTMAVSQFVCGVYAERMDPRTVGVWCGIVAIGTGLLWGSLWHFHRRRRPPLVAPQTLAEAKALARMGQPAAPQE